MAAVDAGLLGGVTNSASGVNGYLNNFWQNTPYNMNWTQGSTIADKLDTFNQFGKISAGNYQGGSNYDRGVNISSKEDVPGVEDKYDPTGFSQAEWEFQRQLELLAEQRAYNSAEAQKNRDWQERMSSSAYQRAVEDLEKAGLNKWLAVTGGNGASASTPSGATASSQAGDVSQPTPYLMKSILQAFTSMFGSAMKILSLLG